MIVINVECGRRRDIAFAFNASEFDFVEACRRRFVLFVFRGVFFLGVRNRFLAAARRKWIAFTRAMTDPAKIDIYTNANTAAVMMIVPVLFVVMFAAPAFAGPLAAAASAG